MRAWQRLRGRTDARVGGAIAAVVVLAALLGPLLVTDPDATDYGATLLPPSGRHWLGTDAAGRDVLARTLTATRTSLGDALLVAGLTAVLGMLVGGTAGYLRGRVDAVLSRLIDVMLGLPDLVVALAIVGALGVGHLNLLLALVLTQWAGTARVTRGLVLGSHHRLDVVTARMAGVPTRRIVTGHVLPGALAQVLAISATGFGGVVLSLAGLSFLGLGAQPPTAELGSMLEDSRGDLAIAPWLAIGPTVAIALTVGAAMLLSEALRDALSVAPGRARSPRRRGPALKARAVRVDDGAQVPLSVTGLRVTYADGTRAVNGVDLRVAAGECVALIGESGCGKTTLARALLQLLPAGTAVEGEVAVGGERLPAPAASLRDLRGRRVGWVGQDPYAACDPLRSVGDHVEQAWRYHRTAVPGDLPDRLERLGVAAPRLRERPHTFSGGMLQRATIAAAVAHAPPLVIADEPTSALDARLADEVLAVLREAGNAVLLISHDLRLVARHCDRIAVMLDGRVVEEGPARQVVDEPRHAYTRLLLDASPVEALP